ncbi:MAG: hypothetical protein WCO06_01625 [Candidatus Roizmanbacteria bacterium]
MTDYVISQLNSTWNYLSQPQKDLIQQGEYLKKVVVEDNKLQFDDYSFIIFPYAKAYEGFLKQLFVDMKFITHDEYVSDHLRIGKLLSPNLKEKLGDRSLFVKITKRSNVEIAEQMWETWKVGRNQIFHYFPHNIKAVSYREADELSNRILNTMHKAHQHLMLLKRLESHMNSKLLQF